MLANRAVYGAVFVCLTLFPLPAAEKPDDGCGASSLVTPSGVFSSMNYPSPYPNNSCYAWTIRVNGSLKIVLKFEDLSIEGVNCDTDHLKILKESHGATYVYWQYCGQPTSYPEVTSHPIYTDASELTVSFRSSHHSSGRGFRLSYSSVNQTDLLNCTSKGIHFSLSNYRKYCPAGCGAATGDVDGDVSQGYRDTSVLCKAAVHAGVILDQFGGPIAVERHRGIRYYEPVRANGLLTRQGSLSESLFTFSTNDCTRQAILHPVAVSSSWESIVSIGSQGDFPIDPAHSVSPTGVWTADSKPWLQLDLGEKKRITGIVTRSSVSLGFVKSYKISYKDKGRWRTYAQSDGADDMIFEGNLDNLYPARNTFNPAFTARYIRVHPLQWEQDINLTAELLGCTYNRTPPVIKATSGVLSESVPDLPDLPIPEEDEIAEHVPSQADLMKLVIIVVSVVCGLVLLLLLGVCLFKVLQKKKSKENIYDSSDLPQTACWKPVKHPSPRHQSTEFTFSYSSEKMDLVTSTMADYQQPLMLGVDTVSRKGSTFRPMDTDTKEEAAADMTAHYDFLHTTNQYALPLTNQEPEYATPIIERHVFRTDGFLPDPSYSVPGTVLTKSSSFNAADSSNYRKVVGSAVSGGYQTPQVVRNGAVKADRLNHSAGVYDSPTCRKPVVLQNGHCSEYQKPQTKNFPTPRDCVRLDPEGSSLTGT